MAKVSNGIEKLPKFTTVWVGCTSVTNRRQTDGRATANSAMKCPHHVLTIRCRPVSLGSCCADGNEDSAQLLQSSLFMSRWCYSYSIRFIWSLGCYDIHVTWGVGGALRRPIDGWRVSTVCIVDAYQADRQRSDLVSVAPIQCSDKSANVSSYFACTWFSGDFPTSIFGAIGWLRGPAV